jgi:hypothetical protein
MEKSGYTASKLHYLAHHIQELHATEIRVCNGTSYPSCYHWIMMEYSVTPIKEVKTSTPQTILETFIS